MQFKVTDPDSGQTLTLEGDSAPTEAELEDIFKQSTRPMPRVELPGGLPTLETPPGIREGTPEENQQIVNESGPLSEIGRSFATTGRLLSGGLADLGLNIEAPGEGYHTENLQAGLSGEEMPSVREAKFLPKPLEITQRAAQGLIESAPKVAAVGALQAGGVPAPVGAAAVFGTTEQGFDPKQAAIAAALPFVGKYGGQLSELVASKFGVTPDKALAFINGAGSTAAAGAYAGVIQSSEIANLPPEQRDAAILDAVSSIVGQSMLGPMGFERLKPTTTGIPNATSTRVESEGNLGEHPGVSQRENLQPNQEQIRKEEGQRAGDSGSSERSPESQGLPEQQLQPIDYANIENPHKVGIEKGLTLTAEDVPELKARQQEVSQRMIDAFAANDEVAAKSAFGEATYLGGVIEGAERKGPNYELYQKQKAESQIAQPTPQEAAAPPAEKLSVDVAKDNIVKWTFEAEKLKSQLPKPTTKKEALLEGDPLLESQTKYDKELTDKIHDLEYRIEQEKQFVDSVEKVEEQTQSAGDKAVESITPLDPESGNPIESDIIGMGGAKAGEEPTAPELAQLSTSLKTLADSSPGSSGTKTAFDLGKAAAQTKDKISESVSGLKAVGQYLKTKLEGMPVWTDFKQALGDRHLALSESAQTARDFVKSANKAIPDEKTQEAISNWIDTGGDDAVLEMAARETKPQYKAGYEAARNLTTEQKTIAANVRNYFDSRLQEAIDAGVLEDGIEDYIHRTYQSDTPWKRGVLAEIRSGVFTGKPALAKQRAFQYDFEAERAGLKPIKSFVKRVAAYDLSLNKAIADRQAVKAMMQIKMPDGRPMIDAAGIGVPVEGVGEKSGATLIKPSFKPTDAENPQNNRGDYKAFDAPALRKWKWVASDENGKPTLVQGDVLIHPDAMKQVRSLFERSTIRQNPVGRAALAVGSTVKQTMLDLSGFHPVQITVHGWEHRSFAPVDRINFEDPKVRGLVRGGLVVGDPRAYELFSEGLSGSSLTRHIPGIGPKLHAIQEWLFNSYIPRLKVSTGLHALERNRARFPKLSEDELNHLTANQMNAAFGELNYEMLGRSKTMQDALRLALLAPDFLEARSRFVGQAATKYGREQFAALAFGAATLYLTARIINKLTSDEYHFEPKNAFSIIHNGRAYSLRTVQGDLLHAATDPGKFVFNRINPVFGRTGFEFLTKRDAFGRTRSYPEMVKDLATTMVPISLRGLLNPREQNLWESFLNAFGVTERRSTSTDTVFQLAQKFKEKKGKVEPGEFIYDSEKDPYRGIKLALRFNKPEDAAQEIANAIREGKTDWPHIVNYFNRYGTVPFSGSSALEKEFVSSLTGDQKKIYQDAQDERKKMKSASREAFRIYKELFQVPK